MTSRVKATSNMLLPLPLMLLLLLIPQQPFVASTPLLTAPVTSGYQIGADQAQPPQLPPSSPSSSSSPSASSSSSSSSSISSSQTATATQKLAQTDGKPVSEPDTQSGGRTQTETQRASTSTGGRVAASPVTDQLPSQTARPSTRSKDGQASPTANQDGETSQHTRKPGEDDQEGKQETLSSPAADDDSSSRDEDDLDLASPEFGLQTFVIIIITILIVLSNCAIIMVVAFTEAFSNFNKIFIYSLATADLLIGLFITPYSIFLSVYRTWVFDGNLFCSVEAYMFTTLISAKMYSLTWLNVDQYVAVRKPERYTAMMSPTRSLCWICFSWVVVISFCCPPLFSFESSAIFDKFSYMCLIDTKKQIAYVLTAGVLVCTPSMVATVITGAYLFTKSFKKQIKVYEKVFVDLSTRPWNYHITFAMSVVFLGTWAPFSCIYILKYFLELEMDHNLLFVLCWVGISTGFSQFIVLTIMSPDFRRALGELIRFPDFCRAASGAPRAASGIEADIRPPAYSSVAIGSDGSPNKATGAGGVGLPPKSGLKGTPDGKREAGLRSGVVAYNEASGSTSTSSIPYVDAYGSGLLDQASNSNSPTPV